MPQPFDYAIQSPNPALSFLGGLDSGQQMRLREQQAQLQQAQDARDAEAQKQTMAIRAAQEGRAAQEFGQAQSDRQAGLEAARRQQADMVGLAMKMQDGTATSADVMQLLASHPEMAGALKDMWSMHSEERKTTDIAGLTRAASAIQAGRPDLAAQMLEEYAKAAANGGQKMDADMANAMAAQVRANPTAALTTIAMTLHAVDPKAAAGIMPAGQDWRPATQEEAAKYGAAFGQINAKTGEFRASSVPQNGITITNPDGTTTQIGGPAGAQKPMTEAQAKANIFASRMEQSDKVIEQLSAEGTSLRGYIAGQVAGGNYLQTDDYQRYAQAKRDFLNAVLRQESGALISQQEFENGDRQYFPQPGDGAAVIAQKAANRRTAIAKIREASGRPGAADGAGSADQAPTAGAHQGSQGQARSSQSPAPGVRIEISDPNLLRYLPQP